MPREPEVYDLKGLNCPLPVLKARRRLAAMTAGERIWLETSDPLAPIDIPAFCSEDGHRMVESQSLPGGHRFLLERGEKSEKISPGAEPLSRTGVI